MVGSRLVTPRSPSAAIGRAGRREVTLQEGDLVLDGRPVPAWDREDVEVVARGVAPLGTAVACDADCCACRGVEIVVCDLNKERGGKVTCVAGWAVEENLHEEARPDLVTPCWAGDRSHRL